MESDPDFSGVAELLLNAVEALRVVKASRQPAGKILK